MKISISINDVLRDTLGQLDYICQKYFDREESVKREDVDSFEFYKFYGFESEKEFNRFLYEDSPLEIFGHANQMGENLMTHFNLFLVDTQEEEEHTVELVSREVSKGIPSTLFFLSKLGCIATNIRFVKENKDEWGDSDILITANPIALKNKPKGKISVKIKTAYNQSIDSDYELESIYDFIKYEDLRETILNREIIK